MFRFVASVPGQELVRLVQHPDVVPDLLLNPRGGHPWGGGAGALAAAALLVTGVLWNKIFKKIGAVF